MQNVPTQTDHTGEIFTSPNLQFFVESFFSSCKCHKGFLGDGRHKCDRTCIETCVNGRCSNFPDFLCLCDLGWTGVDCSVDCGCHNHSTCKTGLKSCDECMHYTEGHNCEKCVVGSFGNATTPHGKTVDDLNRIIH